MNSGCGDPRYAILKRKDEPRRRVMNKALKATRAFILEFRAFSAIKALLDECDEFEYGQIHGNNNKPTEPPRKTISIGSIIAVRLLTAASTHHHRSQQFY